MRRSVAAVLLLPFVLLLPAAGPLPHHTPPDVQWRPEHPRQGSLVVLIVRSTAPYVTGTLWGEPLHFAPDDSGAFVALGAIPLDAPDMVRLSVAVMGEETVTPIPVSRRRVAHEALRTAPRFVRTPDSALAARLAGERRRVRDVLERTHARPRLWEAPFVRPRPSPIRSGFGFERTFNGVVESRHLGVDFAGQRGAPVRVTNRGVVALVDTLFYSGRTIYIDHGAGLLTGYLHLSRALVAEGDTVQRGQIIGRVGASGRVTGPHLHWLARYGEILVDPLDLLTLAWER